MFLLSTVFLLAVSSSSRGELSTPRFVGPPGCNIGVKFVAQPDDWISSSEVNDRSSCALLCGNTDDCLSFNYQMVSNVTTHICELLSNRTDVFGSNMTSDSSYVYMEKVNETANQNNEYGTPSCSEIDQAFRDCTEAHAAGELKDGVYKLRGKVKDVADHYNGEDFLAVCNMTGDQGGWTIIQNRRGITADKTFHRLRLWEEWRWGFGNPGVYDYWLGLQRMHEITDHEDGMIERDFGSQPTQEYKFFDINPDRQFIYFEQMICSEMNIRLYTDSDSSYYEIRIGGASNTVSYIYKYENGALLQKTSHSESNLCSCTEFKGYWLSWVHSPGHQKIIRVGKGNTYMTTAIMGWTDTSPLEVTRIGWRTNSASTANKFRIYKRNYKLRVDFKRTDNHVMAVEYSSFRVGPASEQYKLYLTGFKSAFGKYSVSDAMNVCNGMKFTSYDADNDEWSSQCAQSHNMGWWFKSCHDARINQPYSTAFSWGGANTIRHVMMRIKRTD